jgi:ATP-dependent Clp protease adaptor protein ClpS
MGTEVQEETLTLEEVLAALKVNHRLILWNDDTNTFEHVINCLMKYLDYTEKQAERIAWNAPGVWNVINELVVDYHFEFVE